MEKKKTTKKKTPKKAFEIENAEFYTYEAYKVAELLIGIDNINISAKFHEDRCPFQTDLYTPDGIPSLMLKGPTAIEVKKTLSYATVQEMRMLYEKYGDSYNIVVVYFESTITNLPDKSLDLDKTLIYISFDSLNKKKKTIKKAEGYLAKKAKKDWKEERKEIIRMAKDMVAQGNNVLFLGAGVSMSAEMPSWKDLLKGLMGEVKQLQAQTLEAFKELSSYVLEECGDSSLIMGRYLQTAISLYDSKAVFSELIQKHLYNDNYTSPLLMNLARIVQQKKVNEVITYNFDDLLEQNLAKLNLTDSVDYTAISKDAEIKGHNTLPIYHVHGIIPKEGPVDTVVFSEEEYHKRYSTAFHWSNVEQLHALTRNHCFFVGLSMTDPNLRRLLDAANEMNQSNAINHYAFLQRKSLENYCLSDVNKTCKYVHVSSSLIDKEKQKEIYNLNYSVIEKIFMKLGVNVIWYEDHKKDLPELVAQVFGVTQYEGMDAKELIVLCEKKIDEIKEIETKILNSNAENMDFITAYIKILYARDKASVYRGSVSEAQDMLTVLSNSIKLDDKGEDKMREVLNKAPKYGNDLTGYGDFFRVWLDNIKEYQTLTK